MLSLLLLIIYIKKSHKKGVLKHGPSKTKAFSASIIEKFKINKENFYRTNLNPGDVVIHHTNVIHGAEKNNSLKRTRFAVSLSAVGIKAKTDEKSIKIYKKYLKLN